MGVNMIISGATICDIHGERKADVRIKEGRIVEIGEGLEGEEIYDACGCYLLPGLVDTDVRLKDSQLNAINLEKLSRRALGGGVSTVVLASDTHPRIDDEITLEFVQQHRFLENGATIEASVSALNEDDTLANIAIMLKKGCVAVHTPTICDYNKVSRIAQYVKMAGKPLFYRAVDKSLSESGVMSDGPVASELGLPGISPISEVVHVGAMIEIARHFGIRIVFQSVTEPRSIEMISRARSEGIDVTCETAIHHLLKNDEACRGFDTDAKINPPLVNEMKRRALIEALKNGQIHSISALHQPNSDVKKDITFYDANYGTTSISEYLPLLYTYLVKKEGVAFSTIVKTASHKPGEYIGKTTGEIKEGQECDLIVFDPSRSTAVPHHHSLYKNEILDGKVIMAVCRGQMVRI